jgi:hypothetical protein
MEWNSKPERPPVPHTSHIYNLSLSPQKQRVAVKRSTVTRTRTTSCMLEFEGGGERTAEIITMEPYRCPRGPLDLLGHHKNHQDSKTNQQTATTLPTAPKTRRNNSRQYQTHAGRKLAGFRKFKITSTPSMESGRGQGKTAATLIQNTTTNIAPGETKLQREGREVLRALEIRRRRRRRTGFWGREQKSVSPSLAVLAGERARARDRAGRRARRDCEREERECGRPMQGRVTFALIPSATHSLLRSDSRVRCLPTRQRADGSAPPAWLRLGLAHTRHAQTAHAASPVAAFAAFFLTCPIRKAIKWLIQIPPSSIASRAVKKMRFGN